MYNELHNKTSKKISRNIRIQGSNKRMDITTKQNTVKLSINTNFCYGNPLLPRANISCFILNIRSYWTNMFGIREL